MPRTKKKPLPIPLTPEANGPPDEVMTLGDAAAYLRLPKADVLRLVQEQGLPGRQMGKEWRFLKPAIQAWLSQPVPKAKKDFWEASVGAWKDDPHAEEMLKDIYQRRGRPTPEEG